MKRTSLTRALLVFGITWLGLSGTALPVAGLSAPSLMKESFGDSPAGAPIPCSAPASIDGNCGNYRWYNLCSGYIWIYSCAIPGDEFGTSFKASDGMPCIAPFNTIKRTITYFRNVAPNYNQTVDLRVYKDTDADGCADNSEPIIAQESNLDPALRWNCSNFGAVIPAGTTALIVGYVHHGGIAPACLVTDGARYPLCPLPEPHTFYYGIGRTQCLGLVGPLGTFDNWLCWLVIDSPVSETEDTSWGAIKALYR